MNNKEQKNIKHITTSSDMKNIFKKMLADKTVIRSYIQKHGTLDGFKNDTIIFAKPL